MSCRTVTGCLSAGEPLTAQAREHLRECSACSSLMTALDGQGELPDAKHLRSIQEQMRSGLRPVRPLPPDRVIVLICLTLFIAFAVAAAVPFGFQGFHQLAAGQIMAYYAVILACAVFLSVAVIQAIIPGVKRRAGAGWTLALILIALGAVAVALFRDFGRADFVKAGIPCLRLGLLCAAASGLPAYFLVRKGYSTSPLKTALVTGVFAGLAGVAVLALHCPIRNSAHVIVWHLSAMVISGIGGAGLCRAWLAGVGER